MQIYEHQSKNRYIMLVGATWIMHKEGKTPEEIASKIRQPIEKVNQCIEYCKKAREKYACPVKDYNGEKKIIDKCPATMWPNDMDVTEVEE